VLRVRDFLSVAWPVAAEACAQPFESVTWLAAVQVVTGREGSGPEELAAGGIHRCCPRGAAGLGRAAGQRPGMPGGVRRAGQHRGRGYRAPPRLVPPY